MARRAPSPVNEYEEEEDDGFLPADPPRGRPKEKTSDDYDEYEEYHDGADDEDDDEDEIGDTPLYGGKFGEYNYKYEYGYVDVDDEEDDDDSDDGGVR